MSRISVSYAEEIQQIKDYVKEKAVKKNYSRNQICFFRPLINKPLNIMGSFREAIEAEKTSGNPMPVFSRQSRKSFGMIAEEGFGYYRQLMLQKHSPFSNKDAFHDFVDANYSKFCIDLDEYNTRPTYHEYTATEYQTALFARCVIACTWAFKFTFDFTDPGTSEAKEVLQLLERDRHIRFVINDSGEKGNLPGMYTIYGRPDEEIIRKAPDIGLILFADKKSPRETKLGKLYSANNSDYLKCFAPALYSGVIPRLCRVEYSLPEIGNSDIHKIVFHTGRTSYMTMYALNHSQNDKLQSHPFLRIEINGHLLSEIIKRFDRIEVESQTGFYQSLKKLNREYGFEEEIQCLNEYLNNSWNVHNINISGNIITSDDYCIYVKRSKKVSDANHLFCSVNGGSEINDPCVSYYQNSVIEDIPTIKYSEEPYYFGGELTREAIAELGLTDDSVFWKYYGFTAMSGYSGKDSAHALWLHFNVLGEKTVSESYSQLERYRYMAPEKFENEAIYGYSTMPVTKRSENAGIILRKALSLSIEWKDFITLVFMIVILGWSVSLHETDTRITLVFAVLFIIYLFINLIEKYKSRRRIKQITVRYYRKKWPKKLICRIAGKKGKVDWIFYILTTMRAVILKHSENQ